VPQGGLLIVEGIMASRHARGGRCVLTAMGLGAVLAAAPLARAQTTGPHAPVHGLDLGGSAQSLAIRLAFDGPLTVRLQSARIVNGRTHGRSGEPPMLRIRVRDAGGGVIEEANAWHPLLALRWTGERDQRVWLSRGVGRFLVPYTPNRPPARVELSDLQRQRDLIAVDLADLAVGVGAPVPPTAIVGKPFPLTLPASLTNRGPALSTIASLVTTATAASGAQVSPASIASPAGQLAVHTTRRVAPAFTVTCTKPGTASLTFEARAVPSSPASADLDPANDVVTRVVAVACAASP
jgi:hypothetical protein